MPLDIHLRYQASFTTRVNLEVNMGCPSRIRNRFDRSKIVLTFHVGHKATESLKVFVLLIPVTTLGMKVNALAVALPNLDSGISNRVAFGI